MSREFEIFWFAFQVVAMLGAVLLTHYPVGIAS